MLVKSVTSKLKCENQMSASEFLYNISYKTALETVFNDFITTLYDYTLRFLHVYIHSMKPLTTPIVSYFHHVWNYNFLSFPVFPLFSYVINNSISGVLFYSVFLIVWNFWK